MKLALVFPLLACGACAAAPPHCDLAAAAPPGPAFLWRVHLGDGPVVWLYGTIHDAGEADVPVVARQALDGAPHFASELGDDEPDPKQLQDLARLPWGKVLDQMISADDWWDLVDAMRGAMSADELRHARPWFAMVRLTMHVAPAPRPSMDVALAARARAHSIPVDHLETWSEQMTALGASVDPADLAEAIHARKTLACDLDKMRAAYRSGDAGVMEPLLRVRDPQRLIAARNERWLPKIAGYAVADGAFVAVGLGHLLGETGLPAALARAGYAVERITR